MSDGRAIYPGSRIRVPSVGYEKELDKGEYEMRHMYDKDGMIAYAGAVRVSRRWQSSKYKTPATPRERTEKLTLDDRAAMADAAQARGLRLRYRD